MKTFFLFIYVSNFCPIVNFKAYRVVSRRWRSPLEFGRQCVHLGFVSDSFVFLVYVKVMGAPTRTLDTYIAALAPSSIINEL